MQQFQQRIQARTGWSEAIVSAIRSEEEAELYIRAGLKEMRVNGKPALVQPLIKPELCDAGMVGEEVWRGLARMD